MITRFVGRRVRQLAAGIAASLLCAGAAQAAYMVDGAGIDGSVGALNGTINYAPSSLSEDAQIGRIQLSGTNSDTGAAFSWTTYCVDIFHPLSTGSFDAAPISALNLTDTKLSQLNALLSNVDAYVTSATTSAAAQMAVWEIVNETSASYDLAGGDFNVTNVSADAVDDADKMLQAVTSGDWKPTDGYSMALVTASGNQTQLVYGTDAKPLAPAVPEPGTWAMTIVGFGAIGLAGRRRRREAVFG